MPVRQWKHACREGGQGVSFAPSPCRCGAPKRYDGWHNTSLEVLAWNQKFSGLKSTGAHVDLQMRLFKDTTMACAACDGRGYLEDSGGGGFQVCPDCDGAGYLSTISTEQRAALRAEVLSCFPDAAAPSDLPNPAFNTVIHDLNQRLVLVIPLVRGS